jgi:hypothetical protein
MAAKATATPPATASIVVGGIEYCAVVGVLWLVVVDVVEVKLTEVVVEAEVLAAVVVVEPEAVVEL